MSLVQPDIRPVARRKYRLEQRWSHVYKGHRIFVPPGVEHDGASIPRLAFTLSGLTPDGLLRAAALLHDMLYRHGGHLPSGWCTPNKAWTRKEADVAFYDLMREAGVGKIRAYVAYKGVRMGGWASWQG